MGAEDKGVKDETKQKDTQVFFAEIYRKRQECDWAKNNNAATILFLHGQEK